jgi:type VI secretion system protein ImpH
MASRDGPGPHDLTPYERLIEAPEAHHIFLALRLIEAQFADAPGFGRSRRPREDRVRLTQEPDLAFPPSTIQGFTPPGGQPGQLVNRFFGFFGPHGPLPTHLTEYARERLLQERDPTMVAFLGLFTHRFMSLLYRAWATGQPAVDFDRGPGGRIEGRLAALAGLGGPAFRNRDAMPDLARLRFAGFLAPVPRNPDALTALLSSLFHVPVAVQEFVGCWLELEPGDRSRLGVLGTLGQDAGLGQAVWTRAARFRLRLGPLTRDQFQRLLPGGASLPRLVAAVRSLMGDELEWDVNLILHEAEVPPPVLGGGARLGLTTWIGNRRPGRDAADLFLEPQIYPGAADPAPPQERTAA